MAQGCAGARGSQGWIARVRSRSQASRARVAVRPLRAITSRPKRAFDRPVLPRNQVEVDPAHGRLAAVRLLVDGETAPVRRLRLDRWILRILAGRQEPLQTATVQVEPLVRRL